TASGSYTFKPVLKRTGYENKEGTPVTALFTLPLAKPVVTATSQGGGVIKVEWEAVPEATAYEVYVDGTLKDTTTNTYMDVEGLTAGQEYLFKVKAVRGDDRSEFSDEKKETATASAKIKWESSVFGNGADATKAQIIENNIDLGHDSESTVQLIAGTKNASGKFDKNCGKLQSTGTDGLVFYYTTVPVDNNFTLSATAHVNQWRYSNGQEGFGLMAADMVYPTGTDKWYNSYMADVTKVEYMYDSETGKVSNVGDKVTMKLGVGAQEKIGVTPSNQSNFVVANDLKYTMSPLDIVSAANGAGTYNIVANIEDASQLSGIMNASNITADFNLKIQKNNTGYFITYTDKNGITTTKKFYDPEALNKLDTENVYVGFFASRYADITFQNVTFETVLASDDAPAEERPIEYINPNCKVISETTANAPSYTLTYFANSDGKITVKDENENIIVNNESVTSGVKFEKELTLDRGNNTFNITFTPNADYKPDNDPYKALSSYDPINETFTVAFNSFSGEDGKLYVSPAGKNTGDGTQANPLDIYTAVKYVQPGQTIVLKGGTYKLSSTVTIPRGTDGTADKKISMIADDSGTRPVLDFGGKCAGMIFAGNYWYVKGFDVTNSANGQKGIQISGSYSTFEQLNTYYNGNTGIQVSRYLGTDEFAQWPSYDTILNCTSYCNADSGFEDADGFAAKLTVGDGIVFDGCISHHNADDGWDLFAKVATGSIGTVTIKNSIAYANGWWINRSGAVVDAGNGNGFKMGGDSLSGKHILINSVAYDNKAKGIDSNSCPDIRVQNCTSYNNGSYNVALYTNSASNTDFEVTGLASFRTGTNVKEQLSFKGTQDNSKVYKTVNYFWDETAQISKNSDGEQCTADWFMSTDTRITPTRNADGSIDMHSLLVLTDKAKQGAVINTSENTGKPNISEDSGNNGGNNSGGSSDNSGTTDDSDDYDSSDDSDVSSSDTSDSGSSSTDKKDNTISTIQGTEFVTNNGINNSAAGIVSSVKTDGTVSENITVVNDNASLQTEINNKIEKTAEKTISVFASDETVISADTMKSLATSGKTLSVGVVNEDGKVEAVITIDGTKIKGTPVDFTLEVTTGINAGSNATNIVNITNGRGISTDSVDIVDFTYSGNLPGEFKATVYVADRFKDGTRLAVFYYNPVTGQLENQYQLATVTKGYAEFSFNHCSSYVFIEESALNSTITTSALGSPKTADSNAIIFWLMLMCAAVLVLFGIQASRADGKKRA
ncbi:MAG: right-handed parallel beta-helix repeat-containing protein, partial [Lachnospiraceae bacterium]|nr:right-handed parallel beta-helix repeat-containing protein [Lachnospiraceae bacterium]